MNNQNLTASNVVALNARSLFPSLDDSPLWAEDYVSPRKVEREETPPLFIIREHYPRIATAIELQWGTREMDFYFSNLIIDDRRDRAGFPREVLAAILKLSADHARRFQFDKKEPMADQWGSDRFYKNAHK
jgi:hypothetical protein